MSSDGGISILHRGAPFLPELDLWLDPSRSRPWAFVSHAHSDHYARHQRLVCSTRTAALIEARYGKGRSEVVALEFGEPASISDEFTLRLLPAGHVFGSAQAHLTRHADGATLLYTGDFKLRPGLASEAVEWLPADTLIMETTFGRPAYRLPPTQDVWRRIVAFCLEAVAQGSVPVLFAYSLGKAQEALAGLADANLPVMLHPAAVEMTQVFERWRTFPAYAPLDWDRAAGHVVIAPPTVARSLPPSDRPRKTAMLTGWALQSGAKYRYRVDEAFPLSDHADYDDLLAYVEKVGPKRVLTLHGYAAEFARDLRRRGIEAWSLEGENQLELAFMRSLT